MSKKLVEEEDFHIVDGKKHRDDDSLIKVWATTAVLGLGVVPLTLGVGYPVAIIYNGCKAMLRLAKGQTAIPTRPWPPLICNEKVNLDKVRKPLNERNLQLVLFGVTGFTGGLAAKYVARKYKDSGLKWAIAGRRLAALEKIRVELTEIDPELKNLTIIQADTEDYKSLENMVADTRVIITTVGPFQVYGTPLVKACVEAGTSYCDITGEINWCQVLIDQFDDAAQKTGANIVNMAGHDCIPWDLLALKLAEKLKENGEEMKEINFHESLNGAPSGGTLATVLESFPPKTFKSSLGFDPLMKTPQGGKSEFKTTSKIQVGPWVDENGPSGFFFMAMVMSKCVQRSNALNGYGKNLIYREAEVAPSFPALINRYLSLVPMGFVLAFAPIRDRVIPQPGEGPSAKKMQEGFLEVKGVATGSKGGKVEASIYFDKDAGYFWTAQMLVESGLALALESDKIKAKGGILTPASCQGDVLLQRLINVGVKFRIQSYL